MSGEETRERSGFRRHLSTDSIISETEAMDSSNNLLLGGGNEGDNIDGQNSPPQSTNVSALRGIKRSIDTIAENVKKVMSIQLAAGKALNKMDGRIETLEKSVRVLVGKADKDVNSLESLLTVDGPRYLKKMCMHYLDFKAEDRGEHDLLSVFFIRAKDEGWLCKQTGKAEKDIKHQFRVKKNYLRSQVGMIKIYYKCLIVVPCIFLKYHIAL